MTPTSIQLIPITTEPTQRKRSQPSLGGLEGTTSSSPKGTFKTVCGQDKCHMKNIFNLALARIPLPLKREDRIKVVASRRFYSIFFEHGPKSHKKAVAREHAQVYFYCRCIRKHNFQMRKCATAIIRPCLSVFALEKGRRGSTGALKPEDNRTVVLTLDKGESEGKGTF